jgi:co-chaperonin GroES (HSP10)
MEEIKDINQSGILPTGGHLLVLPDKVEEMTKGGIYMPKTVQDKEQRESTVGILVAAGSGSWTDLDDGKPWATVGDRILYPRHSGVSIIGQDKQSYVLINENYFFK